VQTRNIGRFSVLKKSRVKSILSYVNMKRDINVENGDKIRLKMSHINVNKTFTIQGGAKIFLLASLVIFLIGIL
jgi:hypothetical protein